MAAAHHRFASSVSIHAEQVDWAPDRRGLLIGDSSFPLAGVTAWCHIGPAVQTPYGSTAVDQFMAEPEISRRPAGPSLEVSLARALVPRHCKFRQQSAAVRTAASVYFRL
jgi:hypothetical protein